MTQATMVRYAVGLVLFTMCCSDIAAQSAMPTVNALFNTRMIMSKSDKGTMFPVDVDNREYWLTAKHILTGRKSEPAGQVTAKSVSLSVLNPIGEDIKWDSTDFTVVDPGKDIDIVVLIPKPQLLQVPLPPLKMAIGSFFIGGECSFLGFPYANTWTTGLESTAYKFKMPFIKHCYISGLTMVGSVKELVLDGINNPGFSGGPVLYNTGPAQVVIGVIAGFVNEKAQVYSIEVPETPAHKSASSQQKTNPTKKENVVNLNTGIILAFPIDSVVDAIKKNPVGHPLPNPAPPR